MTMMWLNAPHNQKEEVKVAANLIINTRLLRDYYLNPLHYKKWHGTEKKWKRNKK
jgi:hypothetical protein